MRLYEAAVGGHDADAETVCAAFSRGNRFLIPVIATAIGRGCFGRNLSRSSVRTAYASSSSGSSESEGAVAVLASLR